MYDWPIRLSLTPHRLSFFAGLYRPNARTILHINCIERSADTRIPSFGDTYLSTAAEKVQISQAWQRGWSVTIVWLRARSSDNVCYRTLLNRPVRRPVWHWQVRARQFVASSMGIYASIIYTSFDRPRFLRPYRMLRSLRVRFFPAVAL